MTETTYSASELQAVAGISYRQLNHWCKRGWLKPGSAHTGSGNHRWFSGFEVETATYARRLIGVGFTPKYARKYARDLVKGRWVVSLADGLVRIGPLL